MFYDKPDESWEAYGKKDPYYGVLSSEKYHKNKLTKEAKKAFFLEGDAHIKRTLAYAEKHCGPLKRTVALDYGCGVGRLVFPLAKTFREVIGLDVSKSMLEEAENNVKEQKAKNTRFVLVENDAINVPNDSIDFIHSFIVFQHIPVKRGMKILEELIQKLRSGGVAAIHFTFAREAPLYVKAIHGSRKRFAPLHYAINVAQKRHWKEPLMQMNLYNLNDIEKILNRNAITDSHVQLERDGQHLGVFLFFRKP